MGLFNLKPNNKFQNDQSGKGNTAQTQSRGGQDNLNKMLEKGTLSAEDYAKIVQNRK